MLSLFPPNFVLIDLQTIEVRAVEGVGVESTSPLASGIFETSYHLVLKLENDGSNFVSPKKEANHKSRPKLRSKHIITKRIGYIML